MQFKSKQKFQPKQSNAVQTDFDGLNSLMAKQMGCSHSHNMTGGNNKLNKLVEKTLFELVKKQGASREEIVFVDICDQAPDLFGKPGTQLQRDVQEHWKNTKRRNISSYVRYLERLGVEPGEKTKMLLACDSFDNDTSIVTSSSVAPSLPQPDQARTPPEIEQLALDLDNLSFKSPLKFQSPMQQKPNPFQSPVKRTPFSPAPLGMSLSSGSEVSESPGSRVNPHVINVDTSHPERHLIFDIQHVPRIVHNGWA